MEIRAVSGATVARLEDALCGMVEAGSSVGELKQFLAARVGCSRFRQRLLSDAGRRKTLHELCVPGTVHLVLLSYCPADESLARKLLSTCEQNQLDKLLKVLQRPINPNLRDATQTTALHIAANRGCLECLRLLLEAGADTEAVNALGVTALYMAAQGGHLEVVR